MSSTTLPNQDDRKALWGAYEKAVNEGLPKTAIEKLDEIFSGAVADKAWPEAIRAKATRISVNASINEPAAPLMIKDMLEAIDASPDEMKPVMRVILAEWFFSYYNENRWQFMQRSQTAAPPGDDFETWDLARLLGEIDKHFSAALQSSDELKTIPVSKYDELLSKGSVSDQHRPTLFDFVAFEALRFYALDEQFIREQGSFKITGDGPILASANDFLNWNPQTSDDDSYLLRAMRLYQDLLRFHADDDDRTAWLDTDLSRLVFASQVASGSEVTARYQAALQRFADEQVEHPLSSLALSYLARSFQSAEDNVKALALAQQGKARFPDSVGGHACFNIVDAILLPSLSVETERVWNDAGPTIDVTYRNVDKVYFRLYPFDFSKWRNWGETNDLVYTFTGDEQWKQKLQQPFVAEWSADLEKADDYKDRKQVLPVNVDAASGCYILVASHKADFSETVNQLSACEVWISDLAVVMRNTQGSAQLSGQVVNAISGLPVAGATVSITRWTHDGRNSREVAGKAAQTNADGFFAVPGEPRTYHKLLIEKDGQRLGLIDATYLRGGRSAANLFEQTMFLTDRSIYRPGQSIQFKAIVLSSNQQTNVYKTLSGKRITVSLFDMNNQEVENRDFETNEFGSVSGSFTAPRDRATGQMYLRVTNGPNGQGYVRVEEYKRPKFHVEVDPPKDAPALNQQVTVTGRAMGYTGAPVDGAKVTWRVVRNTMYPSWYYYRYWYMQPNTEPAEIANGESQTDVDGGFKVTFLAEPDLSVDRETDPKFSYSIYADVTDTAGETRSNSRSIQLGYTSLQATLTTGSWLTASEPIKVDINVSNLNSQGQVANGTLKIHALKAPDKVQRASLQGRNWYGYGRPAATDQSHMTSIDVWPLGDVVFEKELTTGADGNASVSHSLPAGAFKAVFETADPSGQAVRAEKAMLVIDPSANKFATKIPNHFSAKSWSAEPGEEFVAIWGTGYISGRAFVELEHRGEIFKSWWTDANNTQETIRVPITEAYRGGLQIRVTYIRENRAYTEQRVINVPWSNKQLTIKWEHFVSKLQPGGKETWTAIVEGPNSQTAAAEMVAAMYDASLDAFAPHNWPGGMSVFYNDYSRTSLQFHNRLNYLGVFHTTWYNNYQDESFYYRTFRDGIGSFWGGGYGRMYYSRNRAGGGGERYAPSAMAMDMAEGAVMESKSAAPMRGDSGGNMFDEEDASRPAADPANVSPDLSQVTARKNLNETAFFYPSLTVDEKGTVRIEFEIPEALTKWKFMGFAHDNELRASLLTDEITTSKDLMVQPNPPRFLREGDVLEFSAKVI